MATVDSAVHDAAEPAGYPREWEFDGLLRNGEAVVARPIRPADAPALVGLHGAVSPATLHRHVLLTGPTLSLETAAGFSERVFEIVFEGDPLLDDRVRREAAQEWSGFSLRRLEKDSQGAWRCTQDIKLRR